MTTEGRTSALAGAAAALMIGAQVAGKATREALFLSSFPISALPIMLVAAALISIATALAATRALSRSGPARLTPVLFVLSAGLSIVEWRLLTNSPRVVSVMVYLHVAVIGSILVSWFWALISECFDPRAAKRVIGRIAAFGTLGGLVGGVIAERVAATAGLQAILPMLAASHVAAGGLLALIRTREASTKQPTQSNRSAVDAIRRVPYLRDLGTLLLLLTVAGTLADFLLKANATELFHDREQLMRFFAGFYTATGLLTFVVQALASKFALERYGLSKTIATLPGASIAAAAAALALPGLATLAVWRGCESVLRHSLFRSAYEIFYTPIPVHEKRAAKPLIDVGFDRAGDAVGGGLIRLTLLFIPGDPRIVLTAAAIACGFGALWLVRRLARGYVAALERSLKQSGLELSDRPWLDRTTRLTYLSMPGIRRPGADTQDGPTSRTLPGGASTPPPGLSESSDPVVATIAALRSGEHTRMRAVLDQPLSDELVPHVVDLLGDDAMARHAARALSSVAEPHVGLLGDRLLNESVSISARKRIAKVLAACPSARSADALIQALACDTFDVREQAARALAKLKASGVSVDGAAIETAIVRDAATSAAKQTGAHDPESLFGVKGPRDRRLEHVFSLLALIVPNEPLVIAYRALHTGDGGLRGTALEYLDTVLPSAVRDAVWPLIEPDHAPRNKPRPEAVVARELLRVADRIRTALDKSPPAEGPAANRNRVDDACE